MLERETRCGRIFTLLGLRKEEVLLIFFTAIRLMAAAAQEWRADLGFVACSMDVKQAFYNVSPRSLSLVMKEMDMAPMLAGTILR